MLSLPDEVADEPIIITRDEQPAIAAISHEQMTSLIELSTMWLKGSPEGTYLQ